MITWRPYQSAAIDKVFEDWKNYSNLLGVAATGAGKAQPLDAKVLTPYGWTTMGRIRIGSLVIGGDGRAYEVSGVYPQGEKDVYLVTFSDGTSAECCAEHLWKVQTQDDKNLNKGYRIIPLEKIMEQGLKSGSKNRWYIPSVREVEFSEIEDLPIDPYVLGCLIGDGGITQCVTLCTADEFIIDQFRARLERVEIKYYSRYTYGITGNGGRCRKDRSFWLIDALRDLNLYGCRSWEKFVPEKYKFSSVSSRIELLRGLMDTDGTSNCYTGRASFSTTSKVLADDVCELVRSLGGVSKVTGGKHDVHKVNGEEKSIRPSYTVSVSIDQNPFLLPRKADRYFPCGRKRKRQKSIVGVEHIGRKICQCIMVDSADHTYVTDGYTVTHNTQIFLGVIERALKEDPMKRILIISHREELVTQPEERIASFFPGLSKKIGVVMGTKRDDHHRQILIGTIQTVGGRSRKRVNEILRYGVIDLLIIDEAHHAEASQYYNLYKLLKTANPNMRVLGVTATPERGDKKLLTRIFEREVFNISAFSLINDGYLAEPIFHGIRTKIDLSKTKTSGKGSKKDYAVGELVSAFETEDVFDLVVKTHLEHCGNKPTIAFTISVAGAIHLAEKMTAKGISAIAIYGAMKSRERADALEGMRSGKYTLLVNCLVATEGFDLPFLENLHIVRPTKSDALYLQIVGRVLRLSQETGKTVAQIFDYLPLDNRKFEQRMQIFKPPKRARKSPDEVAPRGASDPRPKSTGEIEVVILDYLKRRNDAWVTSADGWRCIQLGKGVDKKTNRPVDRGLALSPDGLELWAIWRFRTDEKTGVRGDRWAKARVISTGDAHKNLAMIDTYTQAYGDRIIMSRSAAWRSAEPKDSLRRWGEKLGVYREGMKQGELSDSINLALIMGAVKRGIKEASALEREQMEF